MSGTPPDTLQPWSRRHWVFDLDGTLTHAVHDFDGLRRRLGIPAGAPILEYIESRPPAEAARLADAVEAWELEAVSRARPAPGAPELLDALRRGGHQVGIVTRNTTAVAWRTLHAADLAGYFARDEVLGRDAAPAKPAPDGIRRLLETWGASPTDAVMVGDFHFDLEAGRAAGVGTICVDVPGHGRFGALADRVVRSLHALCP